MKIITSFKIKRGKWYAAIVDIDKPTVVVTDDWMTEWPIQYDDGSIAYDHPYRVPRYAKQLVERAFRELKRGI